MDIRLDTKFPWGNPGTAKLKARRMLKDLGDHGAMCLIRLWCYVGENFPKGVLHGVQESDLEELAGWTGEPGAFASYAIRKRWVDRHEDGTLEVHDWKEHQPYLFHADKRSEAAREAAAARWEGKRKRKVNPPRKRGASGSHADRYAPDPAPDPDPKPEKQDLDLGTKSRSVGGDNGADAPGGSPKAPPGAAPTSLAPEIEKFQANLIERRRMLGIPDTGKKDS